MNTISPRQAFLDLKAGHAMLIDVREPDEFARYHITYAHSWPLSSLDGHVPVIPAGVTKIIMQCEHGMRSERACGYITAPEGGEVVYMEGGIDAWRKADLPTYGTSTRLKLPLMQQVQLAVGSLILLAVILGFALHSGFFALAGLFGAGLIFAGATGFCGMARLLAFAPWNRENRSPNHKNHGHAKPIEQ
jgi:rhodanese-related sulfurtransferase